MKAWRAILAVVACAVLGWWLLGVAFPLRYEEQVRAAGQEYRVDPALLAAVVRQESRFSPAAVSEAGAVGLMQLIPETAEWAADTSGLPLADLRSPEENLRIGAWYLGWLLDRYGGDEVLALAAYNGGIANVDAWLAASGEVLEPREIPFPETREFVVRVQRARHVYRTLYPGLARQGERSCTQPSVRLG